MAIVAISIFESSCQFSPVSNDCVVKKTLFKRKDRWCHLKPSCPVKKKVVHEQTNKLAKKTFLLFSSFFFTHDSCSIWEIFAFPWGMYQHLENLLLAFSSAKISKKWTSLELQVSYLIYRCDKNDSYPL